MCFRWKAFTASLVARTLQIWSHVVSNMCKTHVSNTILLFSIYFSYFMVCPCVVLYPHRRVRVRATFCIHPKCSHYFSNPSYNLHHPLSLVKKDPISPLQPSAAFSGNLVSLTFNFTISYNSQNMINTHPQHEAWQPKYSTFYYEITKALSHDHLGKSFSFCAQTSMIKILEQDTSLLLHCEIHNKCWTNQQICSQLIAPKIFPL